MGQRQTEPEPSLFVQQRPQPRPRRTVRPRQPHGCFLRHALLHCRYPRPTRRHHQPPFRRVQAKRPLPLHGPHRPSCHQGAAHQRPNPARSARQLHRHPARQLRPQALRLSPRRRAHRPKERIRQGGLPRPFRHGQGRLLLLWPGAQLARQPFLRIHHRPHPQRLWTLPPRQSARRLAAAGPSALRSRLAASGLRPRAQPVHHPAKRLPRGSPAHLQERVQAQHLVLPPQPAAQHRPQPPRLQPPRTRRHGHHQALRAVPPVAAGEQEVDKHGRKRPRALLPRTEGKLPFCHAACLHRLLCQCAYQRQPAGSAHGQQRPAPVEQPPLGNELSVEQPGNAAHGFCQRFLSARTQRRGHGIHLRQANGRLHLSSGKRKRQQSPLWQSQLLYAPGQAEAAEAGAEHRCLLPAQHRPQQRLSGAGPAKVCGQYREPHPGPEPPVRPVCRTSRRKGFGDLYPPDLAPRGIRGHRCRLVPLWSPLHGRPPQRLASLHRCNHV